MHNDNLTEEDEQDDDAESPASLEVEGTAPCSEGTGIEHIPELQHDEEREEEAQFVAGQFTLSRTMPHEESGHRADRRILQQIEQT